MLISRISLQIVAFSLLLLCLVQSLVVGSEVEEPKVRCVDAERRELLKIKEDIQIVDGDTDFLSSWGNEAEKRECCKWLGIRCANRSSGHVIMLDLSPSTFGINTTDDILSAWIFRGKISPSLFELRYLTYLDLSFFNLSGSQIPSSIGTLSKLRYISLSMAFLSGEIPSQLANLSSLRVLDLSFNYLTIKSLDWVSSFSSLRVLDLSYIDLSRVSDWMQNIVNKLPRLRNLRLASCYLPEMNNPPSIPFVNSSASLEVLDLSHNNLSASVYPWLFKFSDSLVNLRLQFANLEGSIPDAFGNMTALKHLDLRYNFLKGPIPEAFGNMTALAYLSLKQNELEGSIPKALDNIFGLSYLDLGENNLGGYIPETFGNMTSLSFLNLETNFLEVEIPNSLRSVCTLWVLNLKGNKLRGQLPSLSRLLSRCAHYSLESLDLSENQMTGSLFDHSLFSSLIELRLSSNQLNGAVPDSIGQLTQLEILDISMNALEGVISEAHFSKLTQLHHLDLSNNLNLVLSVPSEWIPPFQLDVIRVGSCKLASQFPKWLRTQKSFSQLDISNCGISDSIPNWFWNSSTYSYVMNLSHNQMTGKIHASYPLDRVDMTSIDLSSNQFEGPIPRFSLEAVASHLSNNKFSTVNSLCDVNDGAVLSFLDISYNQLVGELPDCWSGFKNLEILVLTNNKLSGKIPISIGSSPRLQMLYLVNNSFVGNLPSSLRSCSKLTVLDVGSNKLLGSIPTWLGKSSLDLIILSLRSNRFNGSMHSSLCHLVSLQLLDLSLNDISGSIPNCIGKFTAMKATGQYDTSTSITDFYNGSGDVGYSAQATLIWKGRLSHYESTLRLVKSIDLSSNKLIGEIPMEIVELNRLVSLNLSRNNLSGQIPAEIGQLKSLDALDLSRNHFSGKIPSSLSEVDRLNTLDLSSNNLSGKIPTSTQLQSFDPTTYSGNPELCGPPLPKCPGEDTTTSANTEDAEDLEDQDSFISRGFYISMGLGFAVGFWGFCSPLLLIKSWRYAYFKLLNHAGDWIFVTVAVHKAKLWRMIRR